MVSGEANSQLKIANVVPSRTTLFVILAATCMACVGQNFLNGQANSFLQLLGLALFAIVLHKKPHQSIRNTWLFATVWIAGSVWWLYIALHDVGGMPSIVALLAILLLSAGLATYYALAMGLYHWVGKNQNQYIRYLLFAACWTMAELARGQWFTGFPWSAIGYAHVNSLLSYLAPWVGVYGIGMTAALLAAWMANSLATTDKTIKKLILAAVVLIACLPAHREIETTGEPLQVKLLQGNISQIDKYTSEKRKAYEWYSNALINTDSELTVTPEIAIPYFQQELPKGYWEPLEKKFSTQQQVALLGMPTLSDNKGYGNSAIGLGFGKNQQYDKFHLVPFGEFTPSYLKWFTDLMVNEMGEFNRGDIRQPPFIWKKHRLSVTICYEDLFGEELAARFVNTSVLPTVFVNMSNIAWFGNTMVLNQHLDIARMRSLEFDRPTIRATNTGTTAIISAQGVVIKQLPPYTEGALSGVVNSKDNGMTFYAYWAGHWRLMPLWMLCLGILLICAMVKWLKPKKTAL